jgi:erythromycin esterase-like protein
MKNSVMIILLLAVSFVFAALIIFVSSQQSGVEGEITKDTYDIKSFAVPFSDLNQTQLYEMAGSAKYVLLGESSHGTSEYYKKRADISKNLIKEKGFKFIAVEGDWVQLYEANKYVKGLPGAKPSAAEALSSYARWPHWMWNNREFADFVEWVAQYNKSLTPEEKVGIYGMDLQGIAHSLPKALELIKQTDAKLYDLAVNNYSCFDEFLDNFQNYAGHTQTGNNCEEEAKVVLEEVLKQNEITGYVNDISIFKLEQNVLAVYHGENYYRTSVVNFKESWNARVRYMKQTVERLADFYAPDSKGVIWAHNTHVGDARATNMHKEGIINIGQLLRTKYGNENIFIIGFSTYEGETLAATVWEGEVRLTIVPKAMEGSAEELFEKTGYDKFYLSFNDSTVREILTLPLGHRAKGVVYNPEIERQGNYVATVLPMRYDALIFIRNTTALEAL